MPKLTCKNKECKRSWEYTGNKKSGSNVRCPDCSRMVKIPAVIAVLFILAIGASLAYAEQQVIVELPIDRPFDTQGLVCQADPIGFFCFQNWIWDIPDDVLEKVPPFPQGSTLDSEEYKLYLEEVIPLVENNPLIEREVPESPSAEIVEEETPEDELRVNEEFLDDFEKCFGGLEQSYAFQQEYSFEKFVRQYIRDIGHRDKLAEECIAISHILNFSNTAYPGLVVREDTSTETTDFETRNFPQKSITEEDFEKLEIKYPPWYQDPYGEWTGENRGNPNPILGNATGNLMGRDKTTAEIYAEYKAEKAAAILTDQDLQNIADKNWAIVCEKAFKTSGYGHLAVHKWRTFLANGDCDDALSEEFISKWRPGFASLEEIRDYRNALDAEIERGRQ